MAKNRTLFGVRYPDGSVLPVSSQRAAAGHVDAAAAHAAKNARPGVKAAAALRVVNCEQSPWVDAEPIEEVTLSRLRVA